MKRSFGLIGLTSLLLIFSFVFVGCDTPTSNPSSDPDGPADGIPWVFENQSSCTITVSPQAGYLDQGWKSFTLSTGQSKTIRVDKKYSMIYILYNYANAVDLEWASGEDKGIFKNK
jgi:hypothetical protein